MRNSCMACGRHGEYHEDAEYRACHNCIEKYYSIRFKILKNADLSVYDCSFLSRMNIKIPISNDTDAILESFEDSFKMALKDRSRNHFSTGLRSVSK